MNKTISLLNGRPRRLHNIAALAAVLMFRSPMVAASPNVEMNLSQRQMTVELNGRPTQANLGDSENSHGGYACSLDHERWPLKDQTGVLRIEGPAGPAVRFTTGYASIDGVPPAGSGKQWTLSLWLRPDEGDIGTLNWRIGKRQGQRPARPEVVSLHNANTELFVLRLCRMRPEIQIGQWTAWTDTKLHVGQWAHLSVVRDGGDVRVTVNGKTARLMPMLQLDPRAGSELPPASELPGALPEAEPGAQSNSNTLSLTGHPMPVDGLEGKHVLLCNRFIGAIGSLQLHDTAWTTEQIAAVVSAGETAARQISIVYSVLEDPVARAYGRRRDLTGEKREDYLRRIAWWREAKFGFFMHWGMSCFTGKELSWSRGNGPDQTPVEIYDNLYKQFNPTQYDPVAWSKQVKAGGFRYAVLTTKHHDGFCLWPTKTSEYNIAFTPYQKDVVAMYLKSFREAGLHPGFYFSWPDWWYETKITREKSHEEWLRVRNDFHRAHLAELAANYGPVDLFWFDGGGEFSTVTKLQPKAVVNNRGDGGDYFTPENFMADYPFINPNGSDSPWEVCNGTGGPWGYASEKPDRSASDIIRDLAEVCGKGGNWLLNVAPRSTGELPAAHMEMLRHVGDWLKINGESIYGTHRTKLGRQSFGWTTAKDNELFLHVLDWPGEKLVIEDFYDQVARVVLLANGTKLPFQQNGSTLIITTPKHALDTNNTVIAVSIIARDKALEKRLVVVGDSITVGVGTTSAARRYSTVLTKLLCEEDVQCIEVNLGGSGGALRQQPANYAEMILERRPDIVVIQWGVNDNFWGYSVSQYAAAYEKVVAGLRKAKPKLPIVLTTLVPDFRESTDAESWIGEANIAIQEIAARYGCHLADIHRAFDHRRSLYADAIHPNDEGARVMADTIFRALHQPPVSSDNAQVNMDTPGEKRFLQYLFMTKAMDSRPHWIEVRGLGRQGMTVTTDVPLNIRTAPIYEGGEYTVTIRDEKGLGLSTKTIAVGWQRTIPIQIVPQGRQTLSIDISAVSKP